jgi:hypothetical protein
MRPIKCDILNLAALHALIETVCCTRRPAVFAKSNLYKLLI